MTKYIFIDESGSPGVAQSENDYFLIAAILLNGLESVEKIEKEIDIFRIRADLPSDYEFHRSTNSKKVREKFGKLVASLDYSFMVSYRKKTNNARDTNYDSIAKEIVDNMIDEYDEPIKLYMDTNPLLAKALRRYAKGRLKMLVTERRSHSSNLIQLADYVANIYAGYLRNRKADMIVRQILAKEVLQLKKPPFRMVTDLAC